MLSGETMRTGCAMQPDVTLALPGSRRLFAPPHGSRTRSRSSRRSECCGFIADVRRFLAAARSLLARPRRDFRRGLLLRGAGAGPPRAVPPAAKLAGAEAVFHGNGRLRVPTCAGRRKALPTSFPSRRQECRSTRRIVRIAERIWAAMYKSCASAADGRFESLSPLM